MSWTATWDSSSRCSLVWTDESNIAESVPSFAIYGDLAMNNKVRTITSHLPRKNQQVKNDWKNPTSLTSFIHFQSHIFIYIIYRNCIVVVSPGRILPGLTHLWGTDVLKHQLVKRQRKSQKLGANFSNWTWCSSWYPMHRIKARSNAKWRRKLQYFLVYNLFFNFAWYSNKY